MTAREPVVRARELAVDGLLAGVSFELGAGECLAIIDEHDVRRTALLQCISGARQPDSGAIDAAASVAVWHDDGLAEQVPVEQTIASRLGAHVDEARGLLERIGLAHRAAHEPWAMSAGERRRIAIELALSAQRPLVILDEPERGLDKAALRWLTERVRAARDVGTTIVLATHNEALADACGDVVVDEL